MDSDMNVFKDHLDLDQLNESTMGDRDLQCELFQLFFGQCPDYLDQMRDSVVSGNVKNWRSAAHAIKGSALGIGFFNIAQCAKIAEGMEPDAATLEKLQITVDQAQNTASVCMLQN